MPRANALFLARTRLTAHQGKGESVFDFGYDPNGGNPLSIVCAAWGRKLAAWRAWSTGWRLPEKRHIAGEAEIRPAQGLQAAAAKAGSTLIQGAVATIGVFDQLLVAAEVVVCLDAVDAVALVVVVSNVFGQACPPGEGFGVDGLAVCGRGLVAGNGCLLDPVEVRLDEAEECSGGVAGLRQVVFLAPREPAAMQLADILVWGEFAGFAVDGGGKGA